MKGVADSHGNGISDSVIHRKFLSVNIHPRHIRFAVALHHAQEFPTVSLIERGMVGYEIGRRNAF